MMAWRVLLTRWRTKSCFQAVDCPSWNRMDSASSGIMNTVVEAFRCMVKRWCLQVGCFEEVASRGVDQSSCPGTSA